MGIVACRPQRDEAHASSRFPVVFYYAEILANDEIMSHSFLAHHAGRGLRQGLQIVFSTVIDLQCGGGRCMTL